MTRRALGAACVELVRGDITRENVEAIVNAANSTLLGGGGVDGAIHRAGGPEILEDCRRVSAEQGPLPPGEAVLTTAGRLPCRHVIHTVGPVWRGGGAGEAEILARCYISSLTLAASHGLSSIAFPSISTGAFGYPIEKAARVALRAVRDGLVAASSVRLARFVLFSEDDLKTYAAALDELEATTAR